MAETRRFGAPLLEAGQAQKHVTVNEALTRFDALAAGHLRSRSLTAPPADAVDGDAFVVPKGAFGDWSGRDGAIALRDNGGWVFAAPLVGRRVWIGDEDAEAAFDGAGWATLGRPARSGAAIRLETLVIDHVLGVGATSVTAAIIPDKASVIGVTARVTADLTGPGLTAWGLGAPGASGRYGRGYGLGRGSHAHGVTGQPVAYFGATPLVLEAEGGAFAAGAVRLAAHCLVLDPPEAV